MLCVPHTSTRLNVCIWLFRIVQNWPKSLFTCNPFEISLDQNINLWLCVDSFVWFWLHFCPAQTFWPQSTATHSIRQQNRKLERETQVRQLCRHSHEAANKIKTNTIYSNLIDVMDRICTLLSFINRRWFFLHIHELESTGIDHIERMAKPKPKKKHTHTKFEYTSALLPPHTLNTIIKCSKFIALQWLLRHTGSSNCPLINMH